MVQENVALLAHHVGSTTSDRRTRILAETSITLGQEIKDAFIITLMPERPRKSPRDAFYGKSENAIADRLQNELVDFARSQSNAQL